MNNFFGLCSEHAAIEKMYVKFAACQDLEIDFLQWFVETFTYV